MRRLLLGACCAALLGSALLVAQTGAQVKKGKERPLQTRHLMAGLVQVQCAALGKAIQGAGPTDDKGWDQAAQNAELLNESGHILMADGRCPDMVWAEAAKTLRECSAAVLKAIEQKNAEAARGAFGELLKACGSCHAAHKK